MTGSAQATPPRDVVLSWSGGKDSALALTALRESPEWRVAALFTAVTAGYDRISIHGVRRSLLEAQARSLDLPLHTIVIQPRSSNADYENAFHTGLAELRAAHAAAAHLAFGDLFLEDVRQYRERLLAASGWTPVFPLWGFDTHTLARQFIGDGYSARLVCVDTTQLDPRFAGRMFDGALLAELDAAVDPCGERGEFHTFVSDGPGFRAAIPCVPGEIILRDERFMYCDLVD